MKPPRAPVRLLRAPSLWLALALVALGALAPVVANDAPLALRRDGAWSFPAFAELVGRAAVAPDGGGWRDWLALSRPDVVVWMPPVPHGPLATDAALAGVGPSKAHWLGCDELGRDLLARIVHGASALSSLAAPAVALALVVGALLGTWAGLRRGWFEACVLRLVELTACLPLLLFLMFAAAFLGDSATVARLALAALLWPSFARIARAEALALAQREFVRTARGLGVSEARLLFAHVLPQMKGPLATTAAFCVAAAVVAEATLAFLGLATGSASTSWGEMLRSGVERAALGEWRPWAAPAAALTLVVLACHRVAERFRDDPAR
ncbi:MAG: ABC transporter permease [Planctomycetes bacterium]|nr:ABC transporter permease [Planctomycetota bacterium]